MKNCRQNPAQTIWEHGLSVASYYEDIRNHLELSTPLNYQWRLPDWIYNSTLLKNQFPREIMKQYHIYHDCGKPVCKTTDDCGKVHFPDHACISGNTWRGAGGDDTIELDMLIHTMSLDDIISFKSRPECYSLLLTGLAELHSNTTMFGGIESTSFKIKWKHLNKIGKRMLNE